MAHVAERIRHMTDWQGMSARYTISVTVEVADDESPDESVTGTAEGTFTIADNTETDGLQRALLDVTQAANLDGLRKLRIRLGT